jgi:hypothetical protein
VRWPKIGKSRGSLPVQKLTVLPAEPMTITPIGPLPVEAQVFLRVMGEDLSGARDLLRDMPLRERAILIFYSEQMTALVYEASERDGLI